MKKLWIVIIIIGLASSVMAHDPLCMGERQVYLNGDSALVRPEKIKILALRWASKNEKIVIFSNDIDKMTDKQVLRLAFFVGLAGHGHKTGSAKNWYYNYAKKHLPEYFEKEGE